MPQRSEDLKQVRNLASHAISMGATLVSPTRIRWNIAGACEDPRYFERIGRENTDASLAAVTDPWGDVKIRRTRSPTSGGRFVTMIDHTSGDLKKVYKGGSLVVEMFVKCRQCPTCLRMRAKEWRLRALAEMAGAQRTWFFTLTLSPDQHLLAEYRAQLTATREGLQWHDLVKPREGETAEQLQGRLAGEQFRRRHDAISPDIQKWLKRVRKYSGAKLRYILVAEAHKTGLPHYHGLIHEYSEVPVRKRTLQEEWKLGFSQFRLTEGQSKEAAYVCKYLSKSMIARVRASQGYGKQPALKADQRESAVKDPQEKGGNEVISGKERSTMEGVLGGGTSSSPFILPELRTVL